MPLVQRRMAQYYDRGANRGCCCWLAKATDLNMGITLTFADYPDDMIRIECTKLNKARLIAEHGPDISLPELRHVLASCPRRGQMQDTCEAVFPASYFTGAPNDLSEWQR